MQNIHASWKGGLAISVAAMLWGLDGVVLTPQLRSIDTSLVVALLHLIPFLIMNVFLFKEYRRACRFSFHEWLNLFLIAALGGAAGTLFIVKALFLLEFKPLTIVVLLQKLQPVFAITLAAVVLKEKISRGFLLWAALAVAAGYTLTFGFTLPSLGSADNTLQASLYALMAAAAFGSSTVFSKKAVQSMPFHTATFFRYGITAAIMSLLVLFQGSASSVSDVSSWQWTVFLIIAFTTGSGAIFLYYSGLIKVRAVVATMCELFFPLSAVLFDYFINGARLSLVQWISGGVMVAAVVRLTFTRQNSD
jgi:drug/metabolite transporter (DMT)-like permease